MVYCNRDTSSSSHESVARRCAKEASSPEIARRQAGTAESAEVPRPRRDPFTGRHASFTSIWRERRQKSAVHVKMYHEGRDPCQEEYLSSCWLPFVVKSRSAMKSVVGHHAAQRLLAREALSDQVSHAYLITGSEQIGKTTLALEFACLLQCQGRDAGSPEPCGACDPCRKIAAGSHPDVRLVVRPADKRILPVELVREVIHTSNLAPSVGPWRIFILPEIERMAAAS